MQIDFISHLCLSLPAQMVAKTQSLPEDWPIVDKTKIKNLFPKYEGTAEPYGRTLYRHQKNETYKEQTILNPPLSM